MTATATEIVTLLRGARMRYRNERDVQNGLADLFEFKGWEATREAQLSPGERIDFLIDRIGVEVKIKGSTPHVIQQLDRYCDSGALNILVLVTSRAKHRSIAGYVRNGVPVVVARLPWL